MQIHGGDIYQNEVELDFSANINPFGMPKSVEKAAMEGVRQSVAYPDHNYSKLRASIAKKENIEEEFLVCGNGAADVIFQLVLAYRPKNALLVCPTFAEYEQALRANECRIQKQFLLKENQFQVTEQILEVMEASIDLMFLCNPNNPTGEIIEPALLTRIIKRCKELKILLVLDECFQDFLEEEYQDSRKTWLEDTKFLFILKAFTKMYGMAGVRLGYGMTSNVKLLQRMKEVTQPWNVSTLAQFAGIAACKETTYEIETREYVKVQRKRLKQGLRDLGLKVYESKANYIFFEGPENLYEKCLEQKVLIRSCASYEGLSNSYYRIAVKTEMENQKLLQVLRNILSQ